MGLYLELIFLLGLHRLWRTFDGLVLGLFSQRWQGRLSLVKFTFSTRDSPFSKDFFRPFLKSNPGLLGMLPIFGGGGTSTGRAQYNSGPTKRRVDKKQGRVLKTRGLGRKPAGGQHQNASGGTPPSRGVKKARGATKGTDSTEGLINSTRWCV